jgi:hypothetical protein
MEDKIYQVLRKHRLPLKKREELMPDLLALFNVSQQRELLIAFLEMNNWLSLEGEENAKGVVNSYLKAINCA